MNKKIVIVGVIVVLIGIGLWIITNKENAPSEAALGTEISQNSAMPSSQQYKTHQNASLGVAFEIPSDWVESSPNIIRSPDFKEIPCEGICVGPKIEKGASFSMRTSGVNAKLSDPEEFRKFHAPKPTNYISGREVQLDGELAFIDIVKNPETDQNWRTMTVIHGGKDYNLSFVYDMSPEYEEVFDHFVTSFRFLD